MPGPYYKVDLYFDSLLLKKCVGNRSPEEGLAAADKALDYQLFSQHAASGKKKRKMKKVQSKIHLSTVAGQFTPNLSLKANCLPFARRPQNSRWLLEGGGC